MSLIGTLVVSLDSGYCTRILQNIFNDIGIRFVGLGPIIVINLSTDVDTETRDFFWVFADSPMLQYRIYGQ